MRRRLFPSRSLDPNLDTPPVIQRAHELMMVGSYAEAAVSFERLAQSAEARKGPRAPFFYLQAGQARLMLNQNTAGMANLRRGLEMLAARELYNQLYRAGTRIVGELKSRGLDAEAAEVTSLLQHNVPAMAERPTQGRPNAAKVSLPVRCPACGGPIHPDEVTWLDATTAECAFCGSPLHAEE